MSDFVGIGQTQTPEITNSARLLNGNIVKLSLN